MSTVTDTRPAGYASGESRNGAHTRRSDGVTDRRPAGYSDEPRAVTCAKCDQDVPPEHNILVVSFVVSWELTPRVEDPDGGRPLRAATRAKLWPGGVLCIPCTKELRSQRWPYNSVYPWQTHGARDAGRHRDEYQHRCAWCRRGFYGAIARRHCSDECGEAIRAARRDRGRDVVPRPCDVCGELFTPPRSDGRYCTPACRQKAYRRRNGGAS